jgi:hypothetical protein
MNGGKPPSNRLKMKSNFTIDIRHKQRYLTAKVAMPCWGVNRGSKHNILIYLGLYQNEAKPIGHNAHRSDAARLLATGLRNRPERARHGIYCRAAPPV